MLKVITIGTATRDIFLKSPFFKILRDPEHLKKIGGFPAGKAQCFALGGKIEIDEAILTTGGGATNAAVTFARQNLKTAALIKIGNDESGEAIINDLRKEKIQTIVIKDKELATAYSIILLSSAGERTILVFRGASEDLKKDEIPLDKIKAQWAYIAPGNIPFPIINFLVDYLHKRGILIAINPSKRLIEKKISGLRRILNKAKLVILNREEASYLTGINYSKEKEIFRKIDSVVPGIVAVTDGRNGAMVSDGYRIYEAGIFSAKGGSASGGKEKLVVDRTGAGDAFGSGFVAGLIHKNENCNKISCQARNIEHAIRLGSANATSVIEKVGAKAGILRKAEFENESRWQKLEIKIRNLS